MKSASEIGRVNKPYILLSIIWFLCSNFYDFVSMICLLSIGRFIDHNLKLSSSFRCSQIYKFESYDFGHTLMLWLRCLTNPPHDLISAIWYLWFNLYNFISLKSQTYIGLWLKYVICIICSYDCISMTSIILYYLISMTWNICRGIGFCLPTGVNAIKLLFFVKFRLIS